MPMGFSKNTNLSNVDALMLAIRMFVTGTPLREAARPAGSNVMYSLKCTRRLMRLVAHKRCPAKYVSNPPSDTSEAARRPGVVKVYSFESDRRLGRAEQAELDAVILEIKAVDRRSLRYAGPAPIMITD